MLQCPIKLPAEAVAQKMQLELLCAMAQKLDQMAETLAEQLRRQDELKLQVDDVLERHRRAAEQYFASFPDPCGEEPFDRCPFLELPEGTKRRDLDRGAYVFILPDSTILCVRAGAIQAALPDGTIETLVPNADYRLHTSDGRVFQLDPNCPNCPQPPEEPGEEPDVPEIPADPAQCEEPRP
ncbi:MAG TPA: hypothetical protein P5532_19820 [Planctomycetota bacterium]|nr:hypothetical protein [Planctomycetota bacterium]HRT96677.1 hypothetical protein [Planctomycetota bacterium]